MKLKKTLLFCLIQISINSLLVGQSNDQLNPPAVEFSATPTVAALAKYADTPVSYYSGVPQINIPLYQINANGYTLPISLSYHASGIKIKQEASWAGLGWSLNAGGMITRQIRGIDDFGFNENGGLGYFSNPEYNVPTANLLTCYTQTTPTDCEVTPSAQETPIFGSSYQSCRVHYDAEPDLFLYNFGGYSGKFIVQSLPKVGSRIPGKGIMIDQKNNLKIEYNPTNNRNFKITTPDGIIYEFSKKEESETWFKSTEPVSTEFSNTRSMTNSWLLTKIILTNNSEINFLYKNDGDYGQESLINTTVVDRRIIGSADASYTNRPTNCLPDYEKLEKSISYTRYFDKYVLNEIQWDEGKIVFNTDTRLDLGKGNPQRLSNVEIYNTQNTNPIKTYKFTHDYFNPEYKNQNHEQRKQNLRLKLLQIEEFNIGQTETIPPYKFAYHEEYNLPSKYSNSHDYWGYYNGVNNQQDNLIPKFLPTEVVNLEEFEDFYNSLSSVNISIEKRTIFEKIAASLDKIGIGDLRSGVGFLNSISSEDDIDVIKIPYIKNTTDLRLLELTGADRKSVLKYSKTATLKEITYPSSGTVSYDYELNEHLPLKPLNKTSDSSHNIEFIARNGVQQNNTGVPTSLPITITGNVESIELSYDIRYENFGGVTNLFSNDINLQLVKLEGVSETVIRKFSHTAFQDDIANWPQQEFIKTFKAKYFVDLGPGEYQLKFEVSPYILSTNPDVEILNGTIEYDEIFSEFVTKLKTGGLRIQKIISPKNTRTYDYTISKGISSGKLISSPNYSQVYSIQRSSNLGTVIYTLLKRQSNSNIPTTGTITGNIVGYSVVKENIIGNGNNITSSYVFSNDFERIIDFDVPNTPVITNGYLLGTYHYNEEKLVESIRNKYSTKYTEEIRAANYSPVAYFSGEIGVTQYQIPSKWIPLTSVENTRYNSGSSLDSITNKITYIYNNDITKLHRQPISMETSNSNGERQSSIYYYPESLEFLNDVSDEEKQTAISLIQANRVNERIRTENYIATKKITTQHIVYKQENGLLVPETFKQGKESDDLNTVITYHKYDHKSNILETSNREVGIHTAYIWGYDANYPIAKIENATYEDISEYVTSLQIKSKNDVDHCRETTCTEQILREALLNLRSALPNSMVTTYTYDPLIGITSVTDPKGYTMYYEYDDFNRLEYVKDDEGNLVSENKYNYKN
ncbi:hypothetical protein D1818_10125 [Aquimarina sp. BL5]|uniref:hypothetical protein n=1 Tax=Aquimarina sp. BL5 TaxID=1714860 RepID=UPI000E4D6CD1|nr:hypothetical protein [Aquimarina sp. BL5]AXT51165.1 hypothetical protein D1818_10125 [Aquimarina sp. BL5]RKN09226.1 hypothetical protein D7036_04565 [Aquimarina sp. BL5]